MDACMCVCVCPGSGEDHLHNSLYGAVGFDLLKGIGLVDNNGASRTGVVGRKVVDDATLAESVEALDDCSGADEVPACFGMAFLKG
jgi:hypothetical protein